MKILYVYQAIFPSEISHSLSIMKMCQALTNQGNEVVLSGIRPQYEFSDPIACYGLGGGFRVQTFYYPGIVCRLRLRNFMHANNIKRLINKEKPDLVYSRLCVPALRQVPPDIPIIYEMHSPGPVGEKGSTKRAFEKLIYRKNFKRIVVTTNMLEQYLIKRYPQVEIVLARLSAERPIHISEDQLSEFKRNNISGGNTFHVGYTGFLDNYGLRGTDIICKIAANMPDVDFHVVGGADEMVKYWRDYATSNNIYFYGYKNPNTMPMYLRSFDVVLAPLQVQKIKRAPFGRNMSPLKLPQYFAYGCAIIASNVSSHLEILEDRKNALICEADNVYQWVEAINLLRKDNNLRETIQSGAYKSYLDDFTPEIRIKKILENVI